MTHAKFRARSYAPASPDAGSGAPAGSAAGGSPGLNPLLLSEYRLRGMRKPIRLAARYRDDRGWHDCEIRDVSSRGLGGKSMSPPVKGSYIDVTFRHQVLIGRVIWTRGYHFGLRLATAPRLTKANGKRVNLREAADDPPTDHAPSLAWQAPVPQTAEDAIAKGRRLEFVFLLFCGLCAVAMIASMAYAALASPDTEATAPLRLDADRD